MALVNHALRRLVAKIVYFGPGLSGKTTNLLAIHHMLGVPRRGEVISLTTETGRTLLLDFLHVELPNLGDYRTSLQLFALPGANYRGRQRKLVLKKADGLVLVADSQRVRRLANLESLQATEAELAEAGARLENLPIVVQFNKRDLPNVLPIRDLIGIFDRPNWPWFEAVAVESSGVFETLKAISDATLDRIERDLLRAAPPPLEGWSVLLPGSDREVGISWVPTTVADPFMRLLTL